MSRLANTIAAVGSTAVIVLWGTALWQTGGSVSVKLFFTGVLVAGVASVLVLWAEERRK